MHEIFDNMAALNRKFDIDINHTDMIIHIKTLLEKRGCFNMFPGCPINLENALQTTSEI